MRQTAFGLLTLTLCACSSAAPSSHQSGDDPSSGSNHDPGSLNGDDDHPNVGGDGDESGGDGGGDVCEEHALRSDHLTPDMLIVLDRSGSMDPQNNGGVDRWGGSVQGVKAITTALENSIEFGLMTFPSDPKCGTGTVNVDIGLGKASAIAGVLDGLAPDGSTPTRVSLEAAHDALDHVPITVDEQPHPKYVLLVTDGAPNCEDGADPMIPDISQCFSMPDPSQCIANLTQMAANEVNQAAVDATVKAITDLAKAGIKTYVIGYSTKNVPNLAKALDQMAAAGDTGDTQHRAVEDQAMLLQEFQAIAAVAVSCEFVLDEAPSDASHVRVKLDGKQLNLNDANGWKLSADGKKVTVQGDPCSTLQQGGDHTLSVEVLCERVSPL